MDKREAREIARSRLSELRKRPWDELRQYVEDSESAEIAGPSGAIYQVQTRAVWDGAKDSVLRVWVLVDDGGWRSFAPLRGLRPRTLPALRRYTTRAKAKSSRVAR